MTDPTLERRLFLLALAAGLAVPRPARAGAPTRVTLPFVAVELVVAGLADGRYRAGLVIDLEPRWKTYWKVPGESGVPPRFDWSASRNVAGVEVAWPAPRRFTDASGDAIGYHDRVVLPLLVEPVDAAAAGVVDLALYFAICNDICVPAETRLAAPFAPGRDSLAARVLIDGFAREVPPAVSPRLAVTVVHRAAGGDGPALEVVLAGAGPEADIFVDGPPGLHFREPRLARAEGAATVWRIAADGLEAGRDLAGLRLHLTVVDGDDSVAVPARVE